MKCHGHTLVPVYGCVPKNWTGAKKQNYWQCMYCGTKVKDTKKLRNVSEKELR